MVNLFEEIRFIGILNELKDIENVNKGMFKITNLKIKESSIKILFAFSNYEFLLDFNYFKDHYIITLFDISSKRPKRIKLIENSEIPCILNYISTLNFNPNFKNEEISSTENFDSFLYVYTILMNNLAKRGISILSEEIHSYEDEIVFNYDNKIQIILESNNLDIKYLDENYQDYNENFKESISGITIYYDTFFNREKDINKDFSFDRDVLNKIEKLEDDYFGK